MRSFDNWQREIAQIKAQVARAVERHSNELLVEIQKSMMGAKSGREYERWFGTHRASAPGEAPGIEEGKLWASLKDMKENSLEHKVGTTEGYFDDNRDFIMEYGSATGQFMLVPGKEVAGWLLGAFAPGGVAVSRGEIAPRPYIRPAADKQRNKFYRDLKRLKT